MHVLYCEPGADKQLLEESWVDQTRQVSVITHEGEPPGRSG